MSKLPRITMRDMITQAQTDIKEHPAKIRSILKQLYWMGVMDAHKQTQKEDSLSVTAILDKEQYDEAK